MAQQNAVDARGEHLVKHPGVGADGGLVGAVHRDVHDHRGRAMSTPGRTALGESAHVLGQPLDVKRRVLHVVADVVRPRLRVFHALLEAAFRAFMRPGVVDRLSLCEQLDRFVDAIGLRRLRHRDEDTQRRKHAETEAPLPHVHHGISPPCAVSI